MTVDFNSKLNKFEARQVETIGGRKITITGFGKTRFSAIKECMGNLQEAREKAGLPIKRS